jgi:AcrR family transcriptional regulator
MPAPAPAERREVRRRRLLEAALSLFVDPGFHATSVDEVVAVARTSKSAFYEHFTSKEDCFCHLLEAEAGALMGQVLDAAASGSDHRSRMRLGIEAFVTGCFRQPDVARLFLVEAIGLTPEVEALHRRILARFADTVAAEIRRAQTEDAAYATVDADLFGRAVAGAVSEVTGHSLGVSGGDAARVAEGLCRIFAA